ncbi:MAG: TonB-dependent receptor, partial [Nitrosospira sp.]
SLSPRQDLIASVVYTDRRIASTDLLTNGDARIEDDIRKDAGYQAEAQYLFRDNRFNFIAGGGTYQFQVDNKRHVDFTPSNPESCPEKFFESKCNPDIVDFTAERSIGYLYTNVNHIKNLSLTLGLSYVSLKNVVDYEVNKFNPKLGLQWNLNNDLRLRLAWFETVKSILIANQTLEPTQVAGFNQLFDDTNGTKAQRKGVGLDARIVGDIYGGLEASARNLNVPIFFDGDVNDQKENASKFRLFEKQQESLYRAYLYWLPSQYWIARGEFQFERYTRPVEGRNGNEPNRIETLSVPLSLDYFNPNGIFTKFTMTYLRQGLERQGIDEGPRDSYLLDAVLGYRLPGRRGILSLEGRNLLNEELFYRNGYLRSADRQLYDQRFSPGQTFFVRLTLNF